MALKCIFKKRHLWIIGFKDLKDGKDSFSCKFRPVLFYELTYSTKKKIEFSFEANIAKGFGIPAVNITWESKKSKNTFYSIQ